MPNKTESLRFPELNHLEITGRLAYDPETNEIPSGAIVCNFTIASNRTYKTKDGAKKEDSLFIKVEAWGALGEWLGQELKKGRPVLVSGHLNMNEWTGKNDEKRSSISIVAQRVQILTWGHVDDVVGPAKASEENILKSKPVTPDEDIKF